VREGERLSGTRLTYQSRDSALKKGGLKAALSLARVTNPTRFAFPATAAYLRGFEPVSGVSKFGLFLRMEWTDIGSLSAVARAITGVSWSGRRFFGLHRGPQEAGELSN
jgi:hypothetical protein